MALIFKDKLDVTEGSGSYTLQAYVNNSWYDVHTVTGATQGSVSIGSDVNLIPVDSSLLIAGRSYDFRWIDGAGVMSNVSNLIINGAIVMSGAVGVDASGFPQMELPLKVSGGSGDYTISLATTESTQLLHADHSILSSLGVTDFQNFSIVIPFPIRGTDYGTVFTFQCIDIERSLIDRYQC